MEKFQHSDPEIWGGIECTINRIGNNFRDQFACGGHYTRTDDVDHIAGLGITALRFPVLWERHQQKKDDQINWQWTRYQIEKIRSYKIEPIAGLLHHGSGPAFTDLCQEDFPFLFAEYAGKVAREFPSIRYYTPVNEPLTTARFSGLSGVWYPHHQNDYSFLKILVNQLKAIVMAMKAIREVNPDSILVQTEDLSKTHSTRLLNYQAVFENERRWLTYDILLGRLSEHHVMWNYFMECGIKKSDLYFFVENKCVPGIAGFNYYVTSERYLDHKIDLYPSAMHGGNGRHNYVDIEAVRAGKATGVKNLLAEAWARYKLPLALTEVHLGCTREQQLRWLNEVWEETCTASREGVNVKAITAWSLLGAYDWNSLLTKYDNVYESGAFEIHNDKLRKTAVANFIKEIAKGNYYHHPLLEQNGWWHPGTSATDVVQKRASRGRPILILGKDNTIGNTIARACTEREIKFCSLHQSSVDITSFEEINKMIENWKPWAVINAGDDMVDDDVDLEAGQYYPSDVGDSRLLAELCAQNNVRFMTFSVNPVSKRNNRQVITTSEKAVLVQNPEALILRVHPVFNEISERELQWRRLNVIEKEMTDTVDKEIINAEIFISKLANISLDLLIDAEKGIWLISNEAIINRHDQSNDTNDVESPNGKLFYEHIF